MTGVNVQGTTFSRGDRATPTETFVAMGEVMDWSGLGKSRKSNDVTTLQDTHKRVDDGGIIEVAPLKLVLLYDPADATQTLLRGDIGRGVGNYKFEFSDGTVQDFAGLVTAVEPAGKKGEKIMLNVTIEIDGEITES